MAKKPPTAARTWVGPDQLAPLLVPLAELTRYPATPHMLYEGWGWFTRWVASNGSKRSHAVLNRYALAGMGYRTPEAARAACSAVVAGWVLSGELRHVA